MEKEKYPYSYEELQKTIAQRLTDIGHPERVPNWGMFSGGAESGGTWQRNYAAYQALGFRQRLIHEQFSVDLTTRMLGRDLSLPFAAAPMAVAVSMIREDAFVKIAEGCERCGIAAGIGFPSGAVRGRDMTAACKNSFRIIKPHQNESVLLEELRRGEADGCFAVGIDLDAIAGLKTGDDPGHFGEITKAYSKDMLAEVRKCVKIPFILKGIMSVEDAEDAMKIGADAIVVSTHAGYSLDCGLSPLEVLRGIRKTVGSGAEIYVDSGIRRGTDILKALALGADGVFLGRLMIWGLLLDGADGIEWIVHLLREEMCRTMQLIGVPALKDLDETCLVPLNALGKDILRVNAEQQV